MQLQRGQVVEFDIHALAFGGAGLGKYEGLTVFVDHVMPGDRVKAAFTRLKKQYAEADLIEIVKPSADRIKPCCKYSEVCGGCQLQFMPYEKQLEFKKQHVIDAFERIGKIYSPPVEDVIGCKDQFYYRNKMEFSFGYDAEMNFALGLHLPGRRYDILDLDVCYLQSEFTVVILNAVKKFMIALGWPPFKYSCGQGFLRSLYIREGKRTDEVMVNLCTSDDLPSAIEEGLEAFVEMINSLGKVSSIYWTQVISERGKARKFKEKLLDGKTMLREEMLLENGDSLYFDIPPQAFFQVNTFQGEVLYGEVLKIAGLKEHGTVFDLFCGTGTIGLFLAKHGEKVIGVELNEDAIKVASENARLNNIFNIDFFHGDVAKMLRNLKEQPSLIVVDPPRAGLEPKVINQLNKFNAPEIIYVSCNPSTLARDCGLLAQYGYKVEKIQPVDMFPHSFHIESVTLLKR